MTILEFCLFGKAAKWASKYHGIGRDYVTSPGRQCRCLSVFEKYYLIYLPPLVLNVIVSSCGNLEPAFFITLSQSVSMLSLAF